MIRCVLLASVALHVALMAALPDAKPIVARPAWPPSLVEVATEPPPPPAPPPPIVEKTPAAQPTAPIAAPMRSTRTTTAPPSGETATNEAPGAPSIVEGDGPADFTQTVLSNTPSGPASKIVASAPSAAPAPPALRIVPASSLSRRPGAPGLDAELERNYPIEARRSGISGTARLRVQILSDGRVGKVERISESHAGFGEACARTVRAALWDAPLDADGRAVATEIVYVCKFEVRS